MTQVIQEQQQRQLFRERAQDRAPRDGSSTLETAGERGPFASVSDTLDLNRDWMMAVPPSLVVMSWEIGSLLLFVKSGGWKVA